VKQFLLFQWNKDKMLSFLLNREIDLKGDPMTRIVTTSMENFLFRTPIPRRISKRDLSRIDCPVLAIMAGESLLHDAEKAVKVGRAQVRNIEIESWEGASHALNFEKDRLVNDRVIRFMEKLEERGK
jgi:pimeloyl-ACP methyl ester carboxylesterase